MNETMLAILGFAAIIMLIFLLLRNVTAPAIAFVGVSAVTAVILAGTGTFTIKEMGDFISAGVKRVHSTAALFIFSALFFGIMTDVGMFDSIIDVLMKRVGNNVVGVALMTCVIAMMGHLDGGGAAAFLITVPAMFPVYKRLRMRPVALLLICVTAMGAVNLLPWSGPVMRTASVLEIEANLLWMKLFPIQLVGIVIALFTAVFWGVAEKRRGAGGNSALPGYDDDMPAEGDSVRSSRLGRPEKFWFNVILTLAVILCMVFLKAPSYSIFMIGCVIALLVNYPGAKLQNRVIRSHFGSAIMMTFTILAAGMFLGILEDSQIMNHMANVLASVIPQSMGQFLPLIIGVLSVPLTLLFGTDSYFYGLLPVLTGVGNKFGADPVHIGMAMAVCRNGAAFMSPVVPAAFLGTGLAGVEIKDHIKTCFFWIWGVSIVSLISGLLLGVLHIA